ncbi:MAG: hypothetical protein ACI4GZ_04945 [Ruminococcus sp.]
MANERKKLGFEILLDNFFSNLGRMILVNLIYAVPLFICLAGTFALYRVVLPIAPVVFPLAFLLTSPFFSGVVVLSREFSRGMVPEEGIFKTYLKAVKENWLRFLIGGIFAYFAFVGCFFSVSVYSSLAKASWIFYIPLFIAILICIFFLFFFYALFLITASFELKQKAIYKNSALMTFGELKQNFFATIGVAAVLAVVLLPCIVILHLSNLLPVSTVEIIFFAYLAFALCVLIPSPCAMVVSNFLYPNMKSVIAGIDDSKNNSKAPEPDIKPRGYVEEEEVEKKLTDEEFDALLKGDDEEYIFYNGKMIKRKVLRRQIEKDGKDDEEI